MPLSRRAFIELRRRNKGREKLSECGATISKMEVNVYVVRQ